MRRSRFGILRLLAMIAMIASVSGVFGLSAAAAPGGDSSVSPFLAQTAEQCHELDTDGDLNLTEDELAAVEDETEREALRQFCGDLPSMEVDPPGGVVETGTVEVAVYDCANLESDVAVWGGDATGCEVSTTTVTLTFARQGEGEQTSVNLDVTGSGSKVLSTGTYTVTEAGSLQSTEVTISANTSSSLTLLRPATPQPETFPVTITADPADGGSAEGALVTVEEAGNVAVQSFFQVAQDPVATGTLDANNSVTLNLPAGDYIVTIDGTEQGYGVTSLTITVPVEGAVVVALEALPATGFVEITKFYCEDIDEVVFNGDVIDDDCATGAATFSFYMYGDGTDDYVPLDVWEDGYGFLELDAGTYEVVEEGTQASATIEVVADEVTSVSVANPGVAPAPRDGTVNASVFVCNNIDEVIFSSDSFMTTFAALPTFEPACEPGAATLSFYLIGDGTDDVQQLAVDGTGSITLAPGNYEVIEEGSQARTTITVFAGDFINLDVQIPAGGEVVPGSSVNLVKFYCDTATEVEFLAYDVAEYSERAEEAGAPDCVSGPATFTFYLVGDGTDDYAQLWVNGSGSIGLEPGTYVVVEEGTQAQFELEVLDGENTLLVVNNPMPEDGQVPTPEDPGDDDDADDGTEGVTGLPSTGHGADGGNTGLLMLTAAAASMLAGAGAFVVRRERAA